MTRFNITIAITGLIITAAAILFTLLHSSDLLVLVIMMNVAFIMLGWYFFIGTGLPKEKGADQVSLRSHILLVRLFFVFTVILVNLVIRNELLRVKHLSDPLRKVLSLQGKSYEWKRDEFPRENFAEGRVTGVIAQEIEKVLPELVGTRQDGFKGVAYQEIVPILIEAVKEQQKTIDHQRKEIAGIKIMLQGIKK